jgi:hypothetical protein
MTIFESNLIQQDMFSNQEDLDLTHTYPEQFIKHTQAGKDWINTPQGWIRKTYLSGSVRVDNSVLVSFLVMKSTADIKGTGDLSRVDKVQICVKNGKIGTYTATLLTIGVGEKTLTSEKSNIILPNWMKFMAMSEYRKLITGDGQ